MPENQSEPRQRNESTLYYALGGGLGHVTRACALARQLARLRPGRHRVVSNTPWPDAARRLFAAEPRLELVLLPPERSVAETQDALVEATRDASFDLLVVDTFPRGLGGELARLGREFQDRLGVRRRVLVSRGLPAEYVSQWRLHEW
ncbi:MAG TPA: hypothetical protein PLV92_14430, partial [Pirellulaceae bacterium]|nr:hypothetical protein [Pirellulaceae bacterium]